MNVVEFGSLFEFIRNGMNIKQDKSGDGLPITRIETIANATVDASRVGYAGLTEQECNGWLMQSGDILFSHINSVEHVGKCAVYRGFPDKLVHGMNLLCLRCDQSKLHPEYAKFLIRSTSFRKRLANYINKAVNQASVSIGNLKPIPVSVPPLPEQIRIAAILDQADALRVKRREALAQLDSLTQAIFIEMFGDPDSNPKSWAVKGLGEFCSFVNGGTPSKEVTDYFNGEIPWISSADIADSKIQNVRHFITEMGVKNSSTNVVPADTILLVTRTGVGKVVITDMELCFSQDITALIPNINIINKIYLTFYLKVKESYFQSMARGATIKGITRNVIESLKVPLPPLELQNNFAVRIQAIEVIRESQKKSEFEFHSLFTSLQYRAFRGEL